MANFNTSALAIANATRQSDAQASRSWLGMFGRMILILVKVVPGILYWVITFTTITMPTFLFTLFSTSLTFTMNATTL
jgi:lysophospholipid hydrolase